jgi:hypothetical protein
LRERVHEILVGLFGHVSGVTELLLRECDKSLPFALKRPGRSNEGR